MTEPKRWRWRCTLCPNGVGIAPTRELAESAALRHYLDAGHERRHDKGAS